MDHILPLYKQIDPTSWLYISSLFVIAAFFKFGRLWSVRNLDLIGLIAFAPALQLLQEGGTARHVGFAWLFVVCGFFLIRLLMDPMMVRRPLLEPNMTPGSLLFVGTALLFFVMSNVVTDNPQASDMEGPERLDQLLAREDSSPENEAALAAHGPGYPVLHLIASVPSRVLLRQAADADTANEADREWVHEATVKTMAILSHLAIVSGLVLIGAVHFGNVRTGISAAVLYLMLPYTALMTGRVEHALPGALLVWAVFCYRRPFVAGMLLALATGVIYYPVFLLPLWIGFYWQRGLLRFVVGYTVTLGLLVGTLAFTSSNMDSFVAQLRDMVQWTNFSIEPQDGFWAGNESTTPYRISVLVAHAVLCLSFALWPAQKNLGTLLSCSAVVMLGVQFWHPQGGGLYLAWFLPLLLLTIFRPNLEDRVALAVLGDGWFKRGRLNTSAKAA